MESQSESWQDCDFLKVPFEPLLHCLSFLDDSGLARLETACPPFLRTRVCESASKATVLAALRRASDKAPAVDIVLEAPRGLDRLASRLEGTARAPLHDERPQVALARGLGVPG